MTARTCGEDGTVTGAGRMPALPGAVEPAAPVLASDRGRKLRADGWTL